MNFNLFLCILLSCCWANYNKIYTEHIKSTSRLSYSNSTMFPRFKYIEPRKSTLEITRDSRKISFSTDQDELLVSVNFDVPLLKIPSQFRRTAFKSSFRSLLNTHTEPWLDLFAQVGAALFQYFTAAGKRAKQKINTNSQETAMESLKLILEYMKQYQTHNNSASGVMVIQQTICNFVKQTKNDYYMGNADGMQKILNGLMSLNIGKFLYNGTFLQAAINEGRKQADCEQVFNTSS